METIDLSKNLPEWTKDNERGYQEAIHQRSRASVSITIEKRDGCWEWNVSEDGCGAFGGASRTLADALDWVLRSVLSERN